jgi:phospholipid/cholesterol/gamma-HCH transport system substrate-binding protein
LIDIWRFWIATDPEPEVDIRLSTRIIDQDGKIVAPRLFRETQKVESPVAATAFNDALGRIA